MGCSSAINNTYIHIYIFIHTLNPQAEYNKQIQFNQANDPVRDEWWNGSACSHTRGSQWYSTALQVPADQWGWWQSVLDHVRVGIYI